MKRRITLKSVMIAIVVIGVGLAAMVRPNMLWALVLSVFHFTILLSAILGMLYRRGLKRAYWTGFAVFGWAYYILATFPGFLWSTLSAGRLIIKLIAALETVEWEKLTIDDTLGAWYELATQVDKVSRFAVVCSVGGLAFACLGSIVARLFFEDQPTSTRQDAPAEPARRADDQ